MECITFIKNASFKHTFSVTLLLQGGVQTAAAAAGSIADDVIAGEQLVDRYS